MKKHKHLCGGLLVLIISICLGSPLFAQPTADGRMNPYDLLGRTLQPIAAIFCPAPAQGQVQAPRALTATLVLQEMTDLPPALVGSRIELALQPPDHVLIRGVYAGQTVTICRAGQDVWVSPASIMTELSKAIAPATDSPEPRKKKKKKDGILAPMALPFPAQELAFLPILFTVKDGGANGDSRVLDVQLMPELARHLGVEEWSARLMVFPASQSRTLLTGIDLSRPGWHLFARVERLEYSAELPETTWTPPAPTDLAVPNVAHLDAFQAKALFEALGNQIDVSKTENR